LKQIKERNGTNKSYNAYKQNNFLNSSFMTEEL